MKRFPYSLGLLPDLPDGRDALMCTRLPPKMITPVELDYSQLMSPVRDQGGMGTCVAFASAVGMKEYQEQNERMSHVPLSPLYLYRECKKIDDIPNEEGTYIREAMKVLYQTGVCRESSYPYSIGRRFASIAPDGMADTEAEMFKISTYASIYTTDELISSLVINGPCVGGFWVTDEWTRAGTDGIIKDPPNGARKIGGHAVCIVGYNKKEKWIKIKNSWSTEWGCKGYGTISFAAYEKLLVNCWGSTDLPGGGGGIAPTPEGE